MSFIRPLSRCHEIEYPSEIEHPLEIKSRYKTQAIMLNHAKRCNVNEHLPYIFAFPLGPRTIAFENRLGMDEGYSPGYFMLVYSIRGID